MDKGEMIDFYKSQINESLLPFWLKGSIDREFGGFFTCFDNSGQNLLSTDKFTWSQGRMIWIFARLSEMNIYGEADKKRFLELARSGARFVMDHCLLENGCCTFLMDRQGAAKPLDAESGYDASIYADCFVILGLSRYSAASGDREAYVFARSLYQSVFDRIENNCFKSEPYPAPQGYKMHGIPMIMLNTTQEVAYAMEKMGDADAASIMDRHADRFMNEIMNNHVTPDHILHEMIRLDNSIDEETLPGRYINPGHTIEDMWFIMHQAMKSKNSPMIKKAAAVLKRTFEKGWDSEFGGIQLFADQNGGRPAGRINGFENDRMAQKVIHDWGNKLWWPHSEALYAMLLANRLTGDPTFLDQYKMVFDYTFKTFPNPDKAIGEWIQIRNRQGEPEGKIVALPVKDPFHIIRNMILIIDLLDR